MTTQEKTSLDKKIVDDGFPEANKDHLWISVKVVRTSIQECLKELNGEFNKLRGERILVTENVDYSFNLLEDSIMNVFKKHFGKLAEQEK